MKKEVISGRQGISLIYLTFSAAGILNYTAFGDVNQDFWISIIISAILIIPLFLMFNRLNKLFPNKNFFEIIENIFLGYSVNYDYFYIAFVRSNASGELNTGII